MKTKTFLFYSIVALATLYEVIIELLGVGWFWASFSVCARAIVLLGTGALIGGIVSLGLSKASRQSLILFGSIFAIGFASFGVLFAGGRFLCGEPMDIKVSFLPFALLIVYFWRLVVIHQK